MEKQNRTCGECGEFFRCINESGEILARKARGDEMRIVRNAPACEDFHEAAEAKPDASKVIARIRDLAHEAQHKGEASEFIVAALELAEEYEKLDRLVAVCEKAIEDIGAMIEVVR